MSLGRRRLVFLAMIVVGALASWDLGFDASAFRSRGAEILGRFFVAALQPAWVSQSSGQALYPTVLSAIRDTVVFAAAGMSLALVLGCVLGLLGSRAWWDPDSSRPRGGVRRAVTGATRVVIALMRSVHELLWAMILLSALGLNPLAAVVAIAIPYGGTLAKVFSETLDEVSIASASAMKAAGGTRVQCVLWGILPRALPDMAAYSFYRFECAIRSSAILGFFGFPTLGYALSLSFENLYYREVWTYLYALFFLVILVDAWSGRLRRRFVT